MTDLLARFRADPLGFVRRALLKSVIGRWLYKSGPGYDAQRYWESRFESYGPSLRASGDEGFSEQENRERYVEDARTFVEFCAREGVDFQQARVLEVGCGTGFYTELLRERGVRTYLGVDITDRLFPYLRQRFPEYEFRQLDITERPPGVGDFDLVLMIDVIEHIVEESRLHRAVSHAAECLTPDGLFVLAPVMAEARKRSFYLHDWSLGDVRAGLPEGYRIGAPVAFRDGDLVGVRYGA